MSANPMGYLMARRLAWEAGLAQNRSAGPQIAMQAFQGRHVESDAATERADHERRLELAGIRSSKIPATPEDLAKKLDYERQLAEIKGQTFDQKKSLHEDSQEFKSGESEKNRQGRVGLESVRQRNRVSSQTQRDKARLVEIGLKLKDKALDRGLRIELEAESRDLRERMDTANRDSREGEGRANRAAAGERNAADNVTKVNTTAMNNATSKANNSATNAQKAADRKARIDKDTKRLQQIDEDLRDRRLEAAQRQLLEAEKLQIKVGLEQFKETSKDARAKSREVHGWNMLVKRQAFAEKAITERAKQAATQNDAVNARARVNAIMAAAKAELADADDETEVLEILQRYENALEESVLFNLQPKGK